MLEIENLNFRIKNFSLKDINLTVNRREYFLLLGPTGSGKTLLLRCLLGLEKINSGTIQFNQKVLNNLLPSARNIGYLAQNYLLFPHLNVRENIIFSLKIRKVSPTERERHLIRISELLRIKELLGRKVNKLSGGEKQRVALARALIGEPELLFLDEPFSAIDVGLKHYLWFELKKILTGLKTTVIHITHDIEEAMTLADRMAIIIDGKIRQIGYPQEILLRPASLDIARYFGIKNIFPGKIIKKEKGQFVIDCSGLKFISPEYAGFSPGENVWVVIRPQSIKIVKEDIPLRPELENNLFSGGIVENYFYSDTVSIFVDVSGFILELKFPSVIYTRYNLFPGKKLKIAVWQPDILLYPGSDF